MHVPDRRDSGVASPLIRLTNLRNGWRGRGAAPPKQPRRTCLVIHPPPWQALSDPGQSLTTRFGCKDLVQHTSAGGALSGTRLIIHRSNSSTPFPHRRNNGPLPSDGWSKVGDKTRKLEIKLDSRIYNPIVLNPRTVLFCSAFILAAATRSGKSTDCVDFDASGNSFKKRNL